MDYHHILHILTVKKNDEVNFDEKIENLLEKVKPQLPKEIKKDIEITCYKADDISVRRKYLQTILHVLKALQTEVLSVSDTFMSVNEYRGVKVAIEIIISMGIIPCLLPGVGASIDKLCPNAIHIPQESLTTLAKHNRLVTITRVLTDCYKEISLRPAILTQLGPLLSALLQLAHAPLVKPTNNINANSENFEMTHALYNQLSNEQTEFKYRLNSLIKNCHLASIITEFMVLSGIKGVPSWLKRRTRSYLVDAMMEPTGVMSLMNATIEDMLDIGKHWKKLHVISKLIATSHLDNSEQYYNAICPQLLNILNSKNIKHSINIANSCITALYDVQPNVCVEKIFHVIIAPFRIQDSDFSRCEENFVIKSETEVSESIDNLVKCFIPKDGKFQTLPHVLLKELALPLFHIQRKVYKSVSLLKSKVRELLIHLLSNEKQCDNLFSAFLDHNFHSDYFGEKLRFEFGSQGEIEILKKSKDFDSSERWSEYGNTLFDLVSSNENLSMDVINYLFKWLSISHENKLKLGDETSEEGFNFLIQMMDQQLAVGKLLSNFGNQRSIQKALFKSPEPLLTFVTKLYPNKDDPTTIANVDYEIVYTSLMLVKVIVMEGESTMDWTPFNHFFNVLKTKLSLNLDTSLLNLTREVIDIIKTRGVGRRFQDLSIDDKKEEDFDKALRDLADPLLPVRAHGLMTLTKLIESSDPVAISKKELVLYFFQKNLKDDDSFVYLTAINGLCAMALSFPQQVIELLIEEFINMPQRDKYDEIMPENRAKLGEILVKTTRALGEMASVYKNTLINGFLCGVRDSDSIVRASSLSCLGELCKVLSFRLGNIITEVLYCIGCIIQTDKSQECRRAAVLVITLLIRGLGKEVLTHLANDLVPVYRGLKYLRDNDKDDILRLHAQLALEEIDDIVQNVLFTKPALEKTIFLLP